MPMRATVPLSESLGVVHTPAIEVHEQEPAPAPPEATPEELPASPPPKREPQPTAGMGS